MFFFLVSESVNAMQKGPYSIVCWQTNWEVLYTYAFSEARMLWLEYYCLQFGIFYRTVCISNSFPRHWPRAVWYMIWKQK